MAGYTDKGKDTMLDALAPDEVSLHDGDPGTTGANEIEGGEYARQSVEWNAASEGSKSEKTGDIDFPVPAGAAVKFVGFWKGEDLVASDEVSEESFTNAGTYTLTSATYDLNG